VAELIQGATFRPRLGSSKAEKESLDISSLGELIDKYHKHEATKHHGKTYALLGMASNSDRHADLMPDYNPPWSELLEKVIRPIMGDRIKVFIWHDKQRAEIYGKGHVRGKLR
jgi:hypothetical protein